MNYEPYSPELYEYLFSEIMNSMTIETKSIATRFLKQLGKIGYPLMFDGLRSELVKASVGFANYLDEELIVMEKHMIETFRVCFLDYKITISDENIAGVAIYYTFFRKSKAAQ